MKLSWKLFFITTPIFILFLTVFGSWMVEDSFQSSLKQEIEQCMIENQMFQNSYELTWNALSPVQKEQTTVQSVVESFHRKKDGGNGNARIYGENGEVLYQNNGLQVENSIKKQLNEDNNVGYEIKKWHQEFYVVVLSRSSLQNSADRYIETTRNITQIFRNRTAMYSRYQMGVILLAVLVGGTILLVLFLVMRNVQKLSRATRQFARGKYDTRLEIHSTDEIGRLAADFNWMANAMKVQMERLEGEVRRQEEFTAAFAHELKTPLTSIIGYADTLRQMELSREETDMCAGYIYSQGKRLQTLSYKLLEMTMADKQEIVLKELYVPKFLQEIVETARTSLEEKQMGLTLQVEPGNIYGDRDLLSSLFLNLIDNGRKASEPGTCLHVSGWQEPGGYVVCVEDEGRGIQPEELSKITEAFYMVDKSRSRKEGGAGLGLALCKKIVDLHGAVWRFESQPGKGLRVTVCFGESGERQRRPRRTRSVRTGEGRNGRYRRAR